MNPLIPPSAIIFQSSLCSHQQAENFLILLIGFHALEMATFAFESQYTYKPTPPRPKSTATRRKPALEQVSILNKLQHIRSSSASLSTLRPAVAAADDDNGGYEPGIRGTGTFYSGSDKVNNDETDDDRDLPTIEELLFTKLQSQGFTTGGRGPDETGGVEEVAAYEVGGSVDQSRSAQSDNSGGNPDDPVVLLGDGNLSASEADANEVSLRAESARVPGAGLFDNPEKAIDSTTPAPPRSSDWWHDIDDIPEPAPRLRLAGQGASTPDSLIPHTPSRLSSEPLYVSISTDPEATAPSSSPPLHHCSASPETQLSQEGHLHTGRGVADEHELVDHALDTLLTGVEGARKQQEVEQEKDKGNSQDEDDRPQQEMNVVAPMVTAERVGRSPKVANRRQSLPKLDPSQIPSHNEAGSRSGSDSDDDLNSSDSAGDDQKKARPTKRKQLSSSHDGATRKKRRRLFQQSSSRQRRPFSKPHRQYLKSYSPLDKCSRVATSLNAKGRLHSPAPSMPQSIDTNMSLGKSILSPSSRATPPTLIEIMFRPHPTHCYSFTATIRDHGGRGVSLAQVVRLIASTGHVGKIDDFTFKPIEDHLYLLSGFSRHTSSSITAEASHDQVDAIRTRPPDSKAGDARAFTLRGSKSSGDDDENGLSYSDPELGGEGYSSEDELDCLGTRMNVPWDPIHEQRLLAYKKESKPWKWIFRQFPGRTQAAVRTRLNMVQARGE